MSFIKAFYKKEKKHSLYCGEDSIKKFCVLLRKHAANVISFEKLLSTKKELKLHHDSNIFSIYQKN